MVASKQFNSVLGSEFKFKLVEKLVLAFRKLMLLCPFFLGVQIVNAHSSHSHANIKAMPEWTHKQKGKFHGYFLYYKDKEVYFETDEGSIVHLPISSLLKEDQRKLINKINHIRHLNHSGKEEKDSSSNTSIVFNGMYALACCIILGLTVVMAYLRNRRLRIVIAIIGFSLVLFSFSVIKSKYPRQLRASTNPLKMDSAFTPFKPAISTHWDATYFYVESLGIPETHSMMTGITSWQQQVPIAQCYTGGNAWPIPLNPVIATSPVPVNASHFTKGAIAIAANGVPIFNPYTNTGVDAYLDGQLDNWGGHSGRADDYHYHIAPMHLFTTANLPIAYAFDGFAVYGNLEPDGSAMTFLDSNHGHYGTDGVYHYHGSSSAPYMIGNMVGVVTEDADHQIIPQAVATPIRTPQSPLSGAVITGFTTAATSSTLNYTIGVDNYQVVYNWTSAGIYTFSFIGPIGSSDSIYNGFVPCTVPSFIQKSDIDELACSVFPNPVKDILHIRFTSSIPNPKLVMVYDAFGKLIWNDHLEKPFIDVSKLPNGIFTVLIQLNGKWCIKKIVKIDY